MKSGHIIWTSAELSMGDTRTHFWNGVEYFLSNLTLFGKWELRVEPKISNWILSGLNNTSNQRNVEPLTDFSAVYAFVEYMQLTNKCFIQVYFNVVCLIDLSASTFCPFAVRLLYF
ncbi:hypothetical protein L596_019534 [Steinernema carpocapsae]|uniref:Uncharacterized protein n=1 Tax=Steinernema carpocapsae TaxID=34508 RepID=A0A4U5MQT3_STECR|nr:hypothetical protein L596_019534 [Steinernema carpocapsae]